MVLLIFWKVGGLEAETGEKTKSPFVRLNDYINEGEGNRVEFKSTVRTNLKTGKQGKEITFAWLKAVVAFLNSSGGTLLIGVDDEGRIVGIGPDNFENPDKCQLHLKNVINQHIGAEFSSFIHITLVDVDGKTVVLIECSPATEPVFLRIGRNEEFYIRSGPSSIRLSPSRMISYVLQNMKKR
jgi:predicted HTH transcriptional regulator